MSNDHPWLSSYPPFPWVPPPEWEGTPFAIRRVFFEHHLKTHCNGHFVCRACGYPTLTDGGSYDYCALCHWEDDYQDDPWADMPNGGPNDSSLNQARRNFSKTYCVWSFAEAGEFQEKTRARLFSDEAQRCQQSLCEAFDQLMALSRSQDIASQWKRIECLWQQTAARWEG